MKNNRQAVTYRPTFNVKDLLIEVYGKEYMELVQKKQQDVELNERNTKLILIQDINKCRSLLGEKPCVDELFYKMYDMDTEELQMLQLSYESKLRENRYTSSTRWI
jgi:hypothetical protein